MKKFPPIPFFVSSVALLVVGALTTLNLTCPICDGTGFLKAAQGLQVLDASIKPVSEVPIYQFGECGTPLKKTKFTYAVTVTVTNTGSTEAKGTVKVVFSRHLPGTQTWQQNAEGELIPVDYLPPTVPAYIDIAAGATKTVRFDSTYIDDPLGPAEPLPNVTVTAGEDVSDPTCGGTGTLSFVNWINSKIKPPSFN